MRLVFAGTPPFAATALQALVDAGHEIALVLTQPDRPAGRGMKLAESAVAQTAARAGLKVAKPASLKSPESQDVIRSAAPDVMVVAAYGLLLPRAALEIPAKGCLNIHASLLPRWRGAAPIQRAILAGDEVTGVCIMQMEESLDTGPVLLARETAIGAQENAGDLTVRLGGLGAEAIVEALHELAALTPRPQDDARATYAAKIRKAEARIDWTRPAAEIERQVRAFNPSPGAEGLVGAESLKIWSAEAIDTPSRQPASILRADAGDLVVACGEGALRLEVVQRAGGRRMAAAEMLRGSALRVS